MFLGLFESYYLGLSAPKFVDQNTDLNRFKPVFAHSKLWWTVDRTAVMVFCGPNILQFWSVLVRSDLGLFPVLWPDSQTL